MQEQHKKEAEEMRAQGQRWQQTIQADYARIANIAMEEKAQREAEQTKKAEEADMQLQEERWKQQKMARGADSGAGTGYERCQSSRARTTSRGGKKTRRGGQATTTEEREDEEVGRRQGRVEKE
eukprot:8073311-Pyramimonas_sp.AAC.1